MRVWVHLVTCSTAGSLGKLEIVVVDTVGPSVRHNVTTPSDVPSGSKTAVRVYCALPVGIHTSTVSWKVNAVPMISTTPPQPETACR